MGGTTYSVDDNGAPAGIGVVVLVCSAPSNSGDYTCNDPAGSKLLRETGASVNCDSALLSTCVWVHGIKVRLT